MSECDINDILCEFRTLEALRTLQSNLGNQAFKEKFPQLEGLDTKLTDEIGKSRGNLRDALSKCGNIDLEEETFAQTEPEEEVEEEE